MIFPALAYQSPGNHRRSGGGTYKYIAVNSQTEWDERLAAGWFESSAAAILAAGDKATAPMKPKPKWAITVKKKKKPAKPLDWRKLTKEKQTQLNPIQSDPINDDAPPTRAELESKAIELGIKFDGRTKDKRLAYLIDEKLKG